MEQMEERTCSRSALAPSTSPCAAHSIKRCTGVCAATGALAISLGAFFPVNDFSRPAAGAGGGEAGGRVELSSGDVEGGEAGGRVVD